MLPTSSPPSVTRSKSAMGSTFQRRLKEREVLARAKSQSARSANLSDSPSDGSRKSSMDWQVGDAEKRPFIDSEHDADDGYSISSYSSYHDSKDDKDGEKPRTPRSPMSVPSSRHRWIKRIVVSAAIASLLIIAYRVMSSAHSNATNLPVTTIRPTTQKDGHEPFFSKFYKSHHAAPGTWPVSIQKGHPADLCSICDCHAAPAFYAPSANYADKFPPRPRKTDIYTSANTVDRNEFMRQTILDIYCARQHLSAQQAFKLARRTAGHLDEMTSWSIENLELGKPTVYLTTATSPNGKADILRPQYFRRHGRAIRTWMKKQEEKAKTTHPDWQVVWIIAEDEVDIDPLVVQTLKRTGVPYIYFAYGTTKSWGNAQKNAVMQVAHALSQPRENGGLFGHGPVYGLDDDNKVLPEMLDLLVKVQRIGVFPVGNLGLDGFEAPILNEMGEIVESESLWQFRKYAFDFGGFTFNSSLLGTVISGPMFWKHNDFAGESEFFDQIISNIREIEPLCGKQQLQDCHVMWHNEPLTEIEMMTDEEEIEYVQQWGIEKMFEVMEQQQRDHDARKADEYQRPVGDWEWEFPPEEEAEEVVTEVVEVEVEGDEDGGVSVDDQVVLAEEVDATSKTSKDAKDAKKDAKDATDATDAKKDATSAKDATDAKKDAKDAKDATDATTDAKKEAKDAKEAAKDAKAAKDVKIDAMDAMDAKDAKEAKDTAALAAVVEAFEKATALAAKKNA